jgi:glycosyltransferase involved in cell wall biosynthesis
VGDAPGADEHRSIPATDPAPPRLTMFISSLVTGGAERVMTELANHWAAEGWPITIIHYSDPGTPAAFPLHPAITEVPLGLHRVSRNPISAVMNNVRRILVVRRAIRDSRPDVVLSFMANVIAILATIGLRVPVIVSEHRGPRGELSLPWSILREITYRRAAFVVMLTQSALDHLSRSLQRRARVVPNPLPSAFAAAAAQAREDDRPRPATTGPAIMGVGRLGPEKGFDMLIDAFATIAPAWPTARLVIWGEGDERESLEQHRAERGLEDRVSLPGNTPSPERELREATIFVLSSRKEGLPMVLIEAMAIGCAAIAFDCEHGPRDIIRDGVDGVLVPAGDVAALSDAMDGLLRDDARRAMFSKRAVEVQDRFTIEAVTERWEALFDEARRRR